MSKETKQELITGSEALMRSLEYVGVDTIFGYPGGTIMPVYDALYDHLDKLNHILVRHEQGAAHAAQGYARTSGKVGVVLVTSGPGATNTITGIADAMLDSVPIVVIAGQVGLGSIGTDAFQETDWVGLTQPTSKWSYQIRRPEDIPYAVSRAFYIASSGRPGPVVLDLPKNVQTALTEYHPVKVDFIRSYVPVPPTDPESIQKAAELINQSKKPFLLVGHGVEIADAQDELLGLIEKADIPFGCTMLGLSALPFDHPLNKGMLGMHGNIGPNVNTNKCDLLIAVGMRFSDRVTGIVANYARQAKIIHFEIDPSEINKNIKADLPVMGDCKETIKAVSDLVAKASHTDWSNSFQTYEKLEWEKVINDELYPKEGPMRYGEVINKVAEATNHDGVLVTDVGQNQLSAARYFHLRHPRSIVTSGGLGTMGFGLPAAIGSCYGAPERCVTLFVGDGGVQMTLEELGVVMEHQVPVKIIILNNHFLGNVRQWQELFFRRRYSFTHMVSPDYMKIADAYSIPAVRVYEREQLDESIQKMLTTPGPFIMEVLVAEEENVLPMTPPGSAISEIMLETEN